jgi:cytochrome c oxidase subunit 2
MLNLPEQASTMARSIDTLHYTVILATFAGVTLAAVVAVVFSFKYRQRGETAPLTPAVSAPVWLEIVVFGGLATLFFVWWVVGFRQYRELESPPADSMPVYVTAKQWMWEFAYPSGPTSAELLTVPVGRPVKLIMTSRDVIHSFFVPAFRIKQDVVPGRATTAWFEAVAPGTYDIMCTQYCGVRHSLMRGKVVVLSQADYARWLENAEAPLALPGAKGDGGGLADRGKQIAAERGCLRCHSLDGSRFIGPTWANSFGTTRRMTDGRVVPVDEAYLTQSMMDPNADVALGYPAVMPSYQGVLSPAEISAIVELIRSLREVHTDHQVPQPTDTIELPKETP